MHVLECFICNGWVAVMLPWSFPLDERFRHHSHDLHVAMRPLVIGSGLVSATTAAFAAQVRHWMVLSCGSRAEHLMETGVIGSMHVLGSSDRHGCRATDTWKTRSLLIRLSCTTRGGGGSLTLHSWQ